MAWALGSTRGRKVIHRTSCRYARYPYTWASDRTAEELAEVLRADGAVGWHSGCRVCAPELEEALQRYRDERMRLAVGAALAAVLHADAAVVLPETREGGDAAQQDDHD